MADERNVKIKTKGQSVAVVGLSDFRKQLKKVVQDGGPDGQRLLKDANWKVAQHVVEKAQATAATVGRMQVRAAGNLRASRTAATAQIVGVSNDKVPFFFGAEFGAKQNILRKPRKASGWAGPGRYYGFRQFLPWKKPGNGNTGYFLFPAMRAESQNIVEMYGDELDKISRVIFPEES